MVFDQLSWSVVLEKQQSSHVLGQDFVIASLKLGPFLEMECVD